MTAAKALREAAEEARDYLRTFTSSTADDVSDRLDSAIRAFDAEAVVELVATVDPHVGMRFECRMEEGGVEVGEWLAWNGWAAHRARDCKGTMLATWEWDRESWHEYQRNGTIKILTGPAPGKAAT